MIRKPSRSCSTSSLTTAPARVLFNAVVMSVARTARSISEVTVLTKAGLIALRPKVVIDASGDLDVLARAGAAFLPLEEGETLQPATMMFRFGLIDYDVFNAIAVPEMQALRAAARAKARWRAQRCTRAASPAPATAGSTSAASVSMPPIRSISAAPRSRAQAGVFGSEIHPGQCAGMRRRTADHTRRAARHPRNLAASAARPFSPRTICARGAGFPT